MVIQEQIINKTPNKIKHYEKSKKLSRTNLKEIHGGVIIGGGSV
jgi:hypothetical protein